MRNALDIISKLFEDEDVPVNTSVELEAPAPILTLSASDTAEDVEALKDETEEAGLEEPAFGADEPLPQDAEEPALDVAESRALSIVNDIMETFAHLTKKSSNRKVGKIPVTTTSAVTCPNSCPFKSKCVTDPNGKKKNKTGGCYAAGGPLMMHWQKVTAKTRGTEWHEFCERIKTLVKPGQLWRHNQAGDLPGVGERINPGEMRELIAANEGKRGYTYTHKYNSAENLTLIKEANDSGFTVNLSANSPEHADELLALGVGPVAAVVPTEQTKNFLTPAGNRVVIYPALTHPGVRCETCALCANQRSIIVGFPAHGASKKRASAIASKRSDPVAQDKLNDIIGKIRGAAF